MPKQLWLNLPVKDLNKSKEFFTKLGFSFNTEHGNSPVSTSLVVGKSVVMLFQEETFKSINQTDITDTSKSSEVLFSFDAASKEEVNELAEKAADAGGNVFGKPTEIQGWMYGCAFADLDGHRWNVLYMDESKMKNL